jgi:hypothetical protein
MPPAMPDAWFSFSSSQVSEPEVMVVDYQRDENWAENMLKAVLELVPVRLKQLDANRLSLAEIFDNTSNLIERARSHRLTTKEMSGGTFTISNLGLFEG